MIQTAIKKIVDKQDLTFDEAYQVMSEIMTGQTTPTQNAAFLAALSTKSSRSETIDEIAGCAKAMRDCATLIHHPFEVMDIVGTGGDGSNSFNISTTASFVTAASGIKVAKHGNRAASSKSGTADCLEALGLPLAKTPEQNIKMLEQTNFCFCFAQSYHPSMKYVGSIRKELGIRTVFNILGPLTNPAKPSYQLLGVYDESLLEILAHTLAELGVKRAMVVYGQDKLDEISLSAPTSICELAHGNIHRYTFDPQTIGLSYCQKTDLLGGSPSENAQITKDILTGKIKGAKRHAVLLNAGAAIYLGGKASSLAEGILKAGELIDSGAAYETLLKVIELGKLQEGYND
ncbi:anthranilate phosphoribosyltransferase [Enterococcus columbae]|uniref:Anthranilate phosphoribosyltransferase n=1 Tax=Enterococcus columbae DSM 7374 = ATCC 51263 TaxID=1121865 RepID=S1NE69_9ENTE|nr:anthranilate phosphoribosyltransferase [Enterococcus columbae]EOT39953.1 anthranilate phosphoribosyltransferase [Enterococcus columbae DSM 7374 = ATCC 51263]EOW83938.1 anthranilate phosphoribosyltransferase [Enterococcus columbae DSM 7374 = ATCC 51263]OJG25842.1 anthranilate phosphoribosyltransferase [Enterococcus columbae DSM 7374 = ATCC 51263]